MREIGIVSASARAIDPRQFDFVVAQGGNCFAANCTLVHLDLIERNQFVREHLWRLHPPSLLERPLRWAWYQRSAKLMRQQVRRLPGKTLTVSTALADTLARHCGVDRSTLLPLPNGVDHQEFGPHLRAHRDALRAELGIPGNAFVALFVGGRWVEKGLPDLVRALGLAQNPLTHTVVVGGGDPEAMRALLPPERQSRLHFAGIRRPVAPWYGLADCFAFPSYSEGFGLVALEAAAAGLPVLMTPTGVGPELVSDGETGFTLTHDPVQIATCLDRLAADPALTARLSQAILARSQSYSWERQASEFEALLTGWLTEKK